MKLKKVSMITSFIFGMSVFGALADVNKPTSVEDKIQINFEGEIIEPPCQISPTQGKLPVKFDVVSPEFLNNDFTNEKNIVIDFTCKSSTYTNVTLTFLGTTTAKNTELVTENGTNVVIKLKDEKGHDIIFGNEMGSEKLTGDDFSLKFTASIHKSTDSTVGAVQAGKFTGVANVMIKYS
ncbi:PixA protein [Xenorhabdus mauleonii]|uniref:Pilin (Type 1 fimbria component protein) n=1 Tax=Xenorhabdus mauleonii TaxID=351675 RepID=A0A1I3RSV4_9GAMM|nr:fimbrial protein [Xenorhabdus mauleonii]PHM46466.1 PixA protein [Xenorhabdus mauleonii]SFJ48361.1 Pilin (type 1 fimbria component protein) [Xenorhabdus mauleonii]